MLGKLPLQSSVVCPLPQQENWCSKWEPQLSAELQAGLELVSVDCVHKTDRKGKSLKPEETILLFTIELESFC